MKPKLVLGRRPKCINDGCNNRGQFIGNYRKDGSPIFRNYCALCHRKRSASKKGMTVAEWTNQSHPYLKYRKTYCENAKGDKAGWLGYKCTTTIVHTLQLDVDHLDGNPTNNDPDNLITLCKCCHSIKTNMFADYATKGRKRLGLAY
jgi:5-methylcytosine-specific restriction endonuclease McrA